MDIQKDLPHTPKEIIDAWLEPVARRDDFGWPPTEYNAWHYELGDNPSLAYLASLRWTKQEMALSPDMIIKHDMDRVRDLFQAHVVGVSFSPSISKPEYHDQFRQHIDHLRAHGAFIHPVILEEVDAGLHILDGYYRLCAYFYLGGYLQVENTEIRSAKVDPQQQVWLGKQAS